jgi:hypothetical protein
VSLGYNEDHEESMNLNLNHPYKMVKVKGGLE